MDARGGIDVGEDICPWPVRAESSDLLKLSVLVARSTGISWIGEARSGCALMLTFSGGDQGFKGE
jgi:hypothetical protein